MRLTMKHKFIFLLIIISFSISNAQWVQTSGPYGGTVNIFAVSGSNLFIGTGGAGTNSGGVFRSTNNGTSWTEVSNGLNNKVIKALAVSGNNLFAGTEIDGVFFSTNNGASWTAVNNGLTNKSVNALAAYENNIFVGTSSGVFLSTNNGTNWTAVNNGLYNKDVITFLISGNKIYAGTSSGSFGGVYLSTNNGTNWTLIVLGGKEITALALLDTNLFAGTYGQGVWHYQGGTSWYSASSQLSNSYVRSFAVRDTNLFVATSNGVYVSTNLGKNWTAINNGLPTTVRALNAL